MEATGKAGGLNWKELPKLFTRPEGCPKCKNIGFRGCILVAEVLEVTAEIGRSLRAGATADELRRTAISQGMTTMAADGTRKAAKGLTTLDEILSIVPGCA